MSFFSSMLCPRQQFDGNMDQFTVVSYLLKHLIITRFIRIIPVTWHGAIGLRADFYGCISGRYFIYFYFQVQVVLKNRPYWHVYLHVSLSKSCN